MTDNILSSEKHSGKVLFVYSGNKSGRSYIIENQGASLEERGLSVQYYPITEPGISGYLKHIFLLRKLLRKNNFDVIHAHYGLSGLVALLASPKKNVIISFMGDDLLGSNKSDGSKTFISLILVRINVILARWFYRFSVVKSEQMLKVLSGITNVMLCPNGVSLKTFCPVDRAEAIKHTRFDPGKKNIIFVSDPERPEKNFRLATAAVNLLDDSSISLHAIYNLPNEELRYYYSSADLLILTSYHEGSPNVIKEAMACNCPAVSTDVGNVKDLFGSTPGYLIASYEPADVAEKIRSVLGFSDYAGRTNGRERILEIGLDSDSVAESLLRIYSGLGVRTVLGNIVPVQQKIS